ncbi:MAG TPA: beta-ketoacyl-ACP synthase III [Longimicrobiales bacterium]|nr:beta-ketoacyl-ACP synthase III [Longimicrobiales bacterium]
MKGPKPIVEIVSTGRFLPPHVVTNADIEKMVDTNDEWIRQRTGIVERRFADDLSAADMGYEASKIAMKRAGVQPGEIDLLVCSTATPDRLLPATGCDIQAMLGAKNAAAFDVSAACTGFLYALSIAEGHIASGRGEIALIVATEKMTGIVNWEDRSTFVLFGDGAGAAIVKKAENGRGVLSQFIRSDGNLAELLWRPGGGVKEPFDAAMVDNKNHLVKMAGSEVFKSAVRSMAEAADQALIRAGMTGDDIDILIPHQANIRIIEATAKYAKIPMEKVFVNVDKYGNMSSATVPVALDEAIEQGRVKKGDNVLMVAFGAGFTWGSAVVRW